MFSIIAAVGKNREIGKKGGLVWRLPEDMKYFKEKTMGKTVVMGRKTYESIPGGKGLPHRKNVVLTRKDGNVDAKIRELACSNEEIFVIGGGSIYQMMLPYASRLYLTEVEAVDDDADTFFPEFDKSKYNRVEIGKGSDNGINYVFARYDKK
ncbi:dihydrofolate reductase [Candidatus Saccharibacteria bacterium]|nr:dihydrofolate reductase [Candidatus Saccharibacteria bacterium]